MAMSYRKLVVFGMIVSVHAAAIYGLAHIRATSPAPAMQAIAVRMISLPQETVQRQPIPVRTIAPAISVDPPELPVIDIPAADESPRAITVQTQAPPVVATPDADVPKLVSAVEYLRQPIPRYPPQSRKLREQGLVMLKVLVDESGRACSIEIESSSGYARLDHAAREAVARAAFRPYVEDGAPRRAIVLVPVEFYLNRTSV
jgi:periplasmic protein TonB